MWQIVKITVLARDTVKLTFKSGPELSKIVSPSIQAFDTHFTHEGLLNLGAILVHISELKQRYAFHISNLFNVLFVVQSMYSRPTRQDVAEMILRLLAVWWVDVSAASTSPEVYIDCSRTQPEKMLNSPNDVLVLAGGPHQAEERFIPVTLSPLVLSQWEITSENDMLFITKGGFKHVYPHISGLQLTISKKQLLILFKPVIVPGKDLFGVEESKASCQILIRRFQEADIHEYASNTHVFPAVLLTPATVVYQGDEQKTFTFQIPVVIELTRGSKTCGRQWLKVENFIAAFNRQISLPMGLEPISTLASQPETMIDVDFDLVL